jgi:hypothetical protein
MGSENCNTTNTTTLSEEIIDILLAKSKHFYDEQRVHLIALSVIILIVLLVILLGNSVVIFQTFRSGLKGMRRRLPKSGYKLLNLNANKDGLQTKHTTFTLE